MVIFIKWSMESKHRDPTSVLFSLYFWINALQISFEYFLFIRVLINDWVNIAEHNKWISAMIGQLYFYTACLFLGHTHDGPILNTYLTYKLQIIETIVWKTSLSPLKCQNARIKMSINIEHLKVNSILTLIFRDKKECLKWVFAAIRKLLRWAKTWHCCDLKVEKLREIFCRSRPLWSSSSASLCWAWKTEGNSMQRNFQNWNYRFWPTVEFRIFWNGRRNYICWSLE